MSRLALAVTVVLAANAACARQAPPSATPAPAIQGKPSAPVSIDAEVSSASARVTVRFDADAKDVGIEVHGTDGLVVTSDAAPVEKGAFARGEAASFDVAFTPGPGRSLLAVAVAGKFGGAGKRAAVASFAVGEPSAEQRKTGATVVEGADGERIKIVSPGHIP